MIEINDIKKYIINKKEEIRTIDVKYREVNVDLSRNFIRSIIGPRRVGKTYTIYWYIKSNNLDEKSYLF